MTDDRSAPRPFRYDAEVDPGTKRHIEYPVGETYLGTPVELPITIINGSHDGPRVFLSAAMHGDEVNGVKVLQEVASRYDPADVHGTIVCFHVLNVPGYVAQQRYIPIYDQDLNRSFPGSPTGSTASRMANVVYERFIRQCDLGIDFHTSTRDKLTLFHARSDVDDEAVQRLTRAFGSRLVLAGRGNEGMLRRVASEDAIPTITVEMGEAQRFQPLLIEQALSGVENVFAEYGVLAGRTATEPDMQVVVESTAKKWIRADRGGLVEMKWGPHPVVEEGETLCTVSDHFKREEHVVSAPFSGLLAGILANPRVLPGQPLFHLVRLDDAELDYARELFEQVGFGRLATFHWMGKMGDRMAAYATESEES